MQSSRDPQFPSSPSTWHSQSDATSSPSPQTDTCLFGFVIGNIVGLQYYNGSISGRELVGLVREPLNPYDPNAIKVFNTRGVQVGHIERAVASVLAPLVDENFVIVEGIVPNGKAGRFKIPVQVHVFARPEVFTYVRDSISRGGLQLISNEDASFTLSEADVVKQKKAKGEKSLDEIFKLADENVSKKTVVKALDPPKDIIKSELFVHQKEGLGWLVHRENSNDLPPFWEEKNGEYANVLTNYQMDTRPEPLRGGIFADDMGLGKTLTLLSLISFDKCGGINTKDNDEDGSNIDDRLVVSGSKKAKRGRPSKNDAKRRKVVDSNSNASGRKVTLIVCPPSVFSSWVTQLSEHTKPGKLKVYMYYGERTGDVDELHKYDMVLTTYSTLACEEKWAESPMKKMEWWRVILDEAHVIKNHNTQQSHAVTNLRAKRRWVVTGTPIQNSSLDLYSLMAFLRFEPFSIKSYWSSLVQRPLAQGDSKGLMRLQVLMATISLRRTKDKALIGLPPKTVETCSIELSNEERELYDRVESQAKSVVQSYIQAGSLTNNYSTVLSIILRLRQICTSVALCPSDLQSLFASNNLEDVSNNPELLKKMVSQLQDGEDLDCPICISPPTEIVITICAHIFCRSCILKTLKKTKPLCPLCRHPLSESNLFSSPPSNPEDSKPSTSTSSSKVSALLKLLMSQRDQNPSIKSVVFSQFQKMLLLLEEPLKAAGFNILRLDGSMNARRRCRVIEEFWDLSPGGPKILLASLRATCMGINLTCACRVYLFEPWWNPTVEEQAMDRVYRIGQKEDVKIVRMIAKNSIEERILELQEKKKTLAKDAFGRRGQKDKREVNVDDLRTLMSL